MEPNFQLWLDNEPEYEEWQKQMVKVMAEAYQEYLETAKAELAEHYGN